MRHDEAQAALTRGIRQILDEAGLGHALDEALEHERRSSVPIDPAELARFCESALLDAMLSRVPPHTARALVESALAWASELGMRARRVTGDAAITVPPPPPEGALDAYGDLATGAVHTRPTPVWGLLRSHQATLVPAMWMLVSNDAALSDAARASAPSGTEVLVISSMAVLKGALSRADGPGSCLVLDALSPSISFDRAVAVMVEDALSTRIVLWRMPDAARARLIAAVPHARRWVSLDADVSPREIVQLLRV